MTTPAIATLTLCVPMPPTLTNSGKGRSRHWRVLEREKQGYWTHLAYIDHICRLSSFGDVPWLIPAPPRARFASVWVESYMVLGGAMDDDNAVARHKWLLDWLVAHGYLASDRRTCVRWAAFPTQLVTRKQPASITLTITEREP